LHPTVKEKDPKALAAWAKLAKESLRGHPGIEYLNVSELLYYVDAMKAEAAKRKKEEAAMPWLAKNIERVDMDALYGAAARKKEVDSRKKPAGFYKSNFPAATEKSQGEEAIAAALKAVITVASKEAKEEEKRHAAERLAQGYKYERGFDQDSVTSEESQGDPECVDLSHLKKYKERNSPPYPANKCCGQTRSGNDGKMYHSVAASNGICRWQRVKN